MGVLVPSRYAPYGTVESYHATFVSYGFVPASRQRVALVVMPNGHLWAYPPEDLTVLVTPPVFASRDEADAWFEKMRQLMFVGAGWTEEGLSEATELVRRSVS